MALTLKMDGGNAVLKDGIPVYVDDTDGKELALDGAQMHAKITELNAESKKHRLAAKAATDKLEKFGDVDADDIESFLSTLEELGGPDGIAELQKKGKVDVEAIKRSVTDFYESKLTEVTSQLSGKDEMIRSLLIGSAFTNSKFLNEKTILPPDVAEAYFGKNFRVEDGKVMAYLGDEPIYSRERHGEPASIDEALEVIVGKYPMKDRILKAPGGGSGAPGGGSGKGLDANLAALSPAARITAARAAGITK